MECVKCGKIIDFDDLFCGYCGINQDKFRKYIRKVENKIRKNRDKEYNNNIKNAQKKVELLERLRQNEINRIKDSRWKFIRKGISYNVTEGKIKINGQNYLFSDIKGAEIKSSESFRTVTNTNGKNKQKSKERASLGGALIGSFFGGSMSGKTKIKGKNNQVTTSNDILVCHYIGVVVNINGFNTEIMFLSKSVDKSSWTYNSAINDAQRTVDILRTLSMTPVPKEWLQPEEEQSVLDFNLKIENANKELQKAVEQKPNYDIPESYYK